VSRSLLNKSTRTPTCNFGGVMKISPDVLFGVVAMLGFGCANLMSQPVAKQVGAARALLWRTIFTITLSGIAALSLGDWHRLTASAVLQSLFLGAVSYIPIYCFYKAIEHGKLGVVVPIANAYALITVAAGVLILGEVLTPGIVLGVLCTTLGLVIMTCNPKDWRKSDVWHWRSGAPYALITMVTWGLFFPAIQIPAKQLGAVTNTFFVEAAVGVVAIGHGVYLRQSLAPPTGRYLVLVFGAALAGVVASLGMYTGLAVGSVSIVGPVAAASPVVAGIGAWLCFGEKLRPVQYLAAVTTVAGVAGLALLAGG